MCYSSDYCMPSLCIGKLSPPQHEPFQDEFPARSEGNNFMNHASWDGSGMFTHTYDVLLRLHVSVCFLIVEHFASQQDDSQQKQFHEEANDIGYQVDNYPPLIQDLPSGDLIGMEDSNNSVSVLPGSKQSASNNSQPPSKVCSDPDLWEIFES